MNKLANTTPEMYAIIELELLIRKFLQIKTFVDQGVKLYLQNKCLQF